MNKLFVTDFDRTLYVDQQVSEEMQELVLEWQKFGNLFVIATGRDIESLLEKLKDTALKPDYFICNNGAAIADKDKNILHMETVDNSFARSICSYILSSFSGAAAISTTTEKLSVLGRDGYDDQRGSTRIITLDDIENLTNIVQIHKRIENRKDLAVSLAKDINQLFGEKITAFANVHNVDIVKKGCDKAKAIAFILDNRKELQVSAVIGDSLNDLEMIKKYNGFTLSNGDPEVQRSALRIFGSVAECMKAFI